MQGRSSCDHVKTRMAENFKEPLDDYHLIAIITIPAIYTSVFLGSMWDPYGDADQLPVAIVNHDKKGKLRGKNITSRR